MEPILVATGARPFSRLILTRGDEDVNFRRLSIRVKTNFLRNQKRQISGRCRNPRQEPSFRRSTGCNRQKEPLCLLNRQTGMLELRKMAAIGRMASSISHDMRHSLSIIFANIEFLQHKSSKCCKARLLVYLQEAVTFMVRQTDSLLQFARTGQERPPSRTALSQIIESAICAVKKHPDV
jgi:signal transduction histidine kinase